MNTSFKMAKYACYTMNFAISVVASLPPMLFMTFRDMYGVSYTMLGLLTVVNFVTQLLIDLVFSFFPDKFNIHKTVRVMPVITFVGFLIYAILPMVAPAYVYIWLVVGTFVFAVSGGLTEVLLNPIVAAIPSDNPEREMSKLHSSYAWGVVAVVIISTVLLKIIGNRNWTYLVMLWMFVPLLAAVMFGVSRLPEVSGENEDKQSRKISREILLFIGCIFLGGAAECTMTQWLSGFAETAAGIPKVAGDILGFAVFAFLLGLGRSVYAKRGKNISRVLLLGMAGAAVCYIITALCLNPYIAVFFCVLSGLCVSMLWPGTIIYTGEKIPNPSVAVFAYLAAGGDLGASVAPQLLGVITDGVAKTEMAQRLSQSLMISAEQVGMRAGMLFSSLFPILGVFLIIYIRRYYKAKEEV